jgi:thymus-specific serine protease
MQYWKGETCSVVEFALMLLGISQRANLISNNNTQLCEFMTEALTQAPTKPYWKILSELCQQQQGSECLDVDWSATLKYIKDPVKGQGGGLRSWQWQTCTEFGFYQTCENNSTCPYGKGFHTLEEDFQICEYAFEISPEELQESIEQTQEYYGSNKLLQGGSRILSVNGNVDPWATLARDNDVPNSDDPLLPTFMAEGASHHFWTHARKDTDGPFVTKARSFIYRTVKEWLLLTADSDLEGTLKQS